MDDFWEEDAAVIVALHNAYPKLAAELRAAREMREALEKIKDLAKSWEGRDSVPYWNLGDIAGAALANYEKARDE